MIMVFIILIVNQMILEKFNVNVKTNKNEGGREGDIGLCIIVLYSKCEGPFLKY